MGTVRRFIVVVALSLFPGCGGGFDANDRADAGVDGGFEPTGPAPPAVPELSPCPDGWREVADTGHPEIVTCDPWPEGGRVDCAADEAAFPGSGGCVLVGTPCPAGDYAEDLPAGATVLYAKAGAAAGGDGTAGAPFATIGDALGSATQGTIVALSKGTFDEPVTDTNGVQLWGACVAQTILVSSSSGDSDPTVSLRAVAGAGLRNLQVSGDGEGVSIAGGSVDPAALDSVLVREARGVGVLVKAGAALSAHDLVVRDILPRAAGNDFGEGIELEAGARADLARTAVEGCSTAGINTSSDSTLVATDLVVRDTLAEPSDLDFGYGLYAPAGASIDVRRSAFERNRATCLYVAGPGTTLTLEDVVVRDTEGEERDGVGGYGLDAFDGVTATLSRVTFEGNRLDGMGYDGVETTADVTDVVIRDTRTQASEGLGGVGLGAFFGAQVRIERAAFLRNHAAALFAAQGATAVVLVDASIRDTESDELDNRFGTGIQVSDGARLDLRRASLTNNRNVGVGAIGEAAIATLEDVSIDGTRPQACDPGVCAGHAGGSGLLARTDGQISATRFRLTNETLCGLQFDTGGVVDLHDGEVSGNAIGANVQTEGFDLSRLQDRVVFRDNEVALDGSALPVPDALDASDLRP